MSEQDARRRELLARNAEMRTRIESMMADLKQRTSQLAEKRDEAAARTHEVSSEDGMVTARVDASGTLSELTLSPKSFERTSPDKLAETITSVIREASGGAQRYLGEQFESVDTQLPDLSALIPGAPGLGEAFKPGPLVPPPDPEAERARRSDPVPTPAGLPEHDFDPEPEPEPEPAPAPVRPAPKSARPAPPPDDEWDDEPPDSFLTAGR